MYIPIDAKNAISFATTKEKAPRNFSSSSYSSVSFLNEEREKEREKSDAPAE